MTKLFPIILAISIFAFANQPQQIVHCPTAGLAEHGKMLTQLFVFPGDGLRAKVSLGILNFSQVGISYGAMRIFGRGSVKLDPMPGFELRFRILSEGVKTPAILIGLDTQGYGAYNENLERYEHKSRGGYIVASKNWWWLSGNFGLHGGINYSFEENFARGFSAFVGLDKDIKDAVGIRIEYDLAPGDNEPPRGNGYGYLSASLSVHFAENAWASMNFYDLLGNMPDVPSPSRELFVMFETAVF